MLFDTSKIDEVKALLRKGAQTWTKAEVESVLEEARRRKPPRLDALSTGAQLRYMGMQEKVVEAALQKRFPNTPVASFPIAPVNYLHLVARLDAGIYVLPSDRFLETKEGERLPRDHPASKLWEWALRKCRFHQRIAEIERRMRITPRCAFGHFIWEPGAGGADGGRPRMDIYWPHDVEMMCHWQAPTTSTATWLWALRQPPPTPDARGEWFRVYSREPPDALGGAWGPWKVALLSTEGDEASFAGGATDYPGQLAPVFMLTLSDPAGSPFICEDADLLLKVDDLNVSRSDEGFTLGLQGHSVFWTDDQKELAGQKVGPDAMLKVMPGHQVGVLTPQPSLEAARESRKLKTREMAIERGNNPDAYATEPGPPLSGVAKRVANLTHDTRIAEEAAVVQLLEEEVVLPTLQDVMMAHHPEGRLLEGLVPRMTPRLQPTIEDPVQKMQRLRMAHKDGLISRERYAVEAELYSTEEIAKKAMAELVPQKTTPEAVPSGDGGDEDPTGGGSP